MELGIALIIVAIVLLGIGLWLRAARRRAEERVGAPQEPSTAPTTAELDPTHPRPRVNDLHVRDTEARVWFDVPVPDGGDEVLSELLVHEAVEVVREKQASLPMAQVTDVVALAGKGDAATEMGRTTLETPGELPPRPSAPPMLNFSHIASDPLDAEIAGEGSVPETVAPVRGDTLAPIDQELRLPKAIDTGLRAQGIDPATMTAGDLVTGMLRLVGYDVQEGVNENTFLAHKGGQTTFIRVDPYQPDDPPEVSSETIRGFMIEFESSRSDRGLLVSEKYGPFEVYEKERREPRVRFVTRERLQKMVDAMALG